MDPLKAVRVRKPRRTSSVPGSLTRAAYRRSLPCSFVDALYAAREPFECYRRTEQFENLVRRVPKTISRAIQTVSISSQEGDQQERSEVSVDLNLDSEIVLQQTVKVETDYSASTERGTGTDVNLATSNTTTTVTPIDTFSIPYDPMNTLVAMREKRNVVNRCPEKIAAFLKNLSATLEKTVSVAPLQPETTVTAPTEVPKAGMTKLKSGSGSQYNTRTLDALKDLWEDRRDAPITVSTALGRQRGLFGGTERKELHQLVISILNRVTGDPEKYPEVRNELLRLPIPEANDATLEKIVNVFFTKAVKEHHFCSSYADLVAALCKVPEGQRITGDKSQSLEYRLRQQLLKRCQAEFQRMEEQNIELAEHGGEDRTTESAEESFKERRDLVCGIVRFVGELYLRHIVTGKVIKDILVTSCAGLYRREGICVPPPYTPTELQMDGTISLLAVVDSVFFRTPLGSEMFPEYTKLMEHWSTCYPVSRIRFLLLSVIDRLHKLLAERNVTPATLQHEQQPQLAPVVERQPSSQLLQPTPQSTPRSQQLSPSPPPQQQSQPSSLPTPQPQAQQQQQFPQETRRVANGSVTVRPLALAVTEGSLASTAGRNAMGAPTELSPKANSCVPAGGRSIPAPRSAASRHGSVTLGPSNSIPRSSEPTVKQQATTEIVARYMQDVCHPSCSVEEVAKEIINTFVSVTAVVEVWTERCLKVVKAARDRLVYGAFLASLNRHHNPSLRTTLRRIVMTVFVRAVREKLHDDLPLFSHWTIMICSDSSREVVDEVLLNEALQHLLVNDPTVVRGYLRDVAIQLGMVIAGATNTTGAGIVTAAITPQGSGASSQQQQQQLHWEPSEEGTHFVRYRPLHVVHQFSVNRKRNYVLSILDFPEVRSASVEIDVFCALLTGTPSTEGLFDALRASPLLRSPLVAPEVLSAILHAELCSDTTAFLEENVDLLALVSDGVDRETREILLVAELYLTLKDNTAEAFWPLSAGSRVMARLTGRILSDETLLRAQNYFGPRDERAHHYIGTQPVQLQLRHGGGNSASAGSVSSSSSNNNLHGNSKNASYNSGSNVSATTRRPTFPRR